MSTILRERERQYAVILMKNLVSVPWSDPSAIRFDYINREIVQICLVRITVPSDDFDQAFVKQDISYDNSASICIPSPNCCVTD